MSTITTPKAPKAPKATDAYPGTLPPEQAANVQITPAAPAEPTLQEALTPATGPAPDPSGIVAKQTALFEHAIGLDRVIGRKTTMTAIDMGQDLFDAFDLERPYLSVSGRGKAWGRMVGSFGRLYEVERTKTARTNEWIRANRVHALVEPAARAIIIGTDNEPFDLDTLVALSDWLDNDPKDVSWAIRDGYGPDLNAMVKRVVEDSLSADKTRQAMKDIERGKETARIATMTGADRRVAESDLSTVRKADRTRKVTSAVESFGKAVKAVKETSGKAMRTPEILIELERAGVIDHDARPADPLTMTSADASEFALALWKNNPAAAYVVRDALNRLAADALASESKPSGGPAPCLKDTPVKTSKDA